MAPGVTSRQRATRSAGSRDASLPHCFGFRRQTEAFFLYGLTAILLSSGCAVGHGASTSASACSRLEYGDGGPSRTAYRPCAAEMVAALEILETKSQAAIRGDQGARQEGREALARTNRLMRDAGGRRLLERWQDTALTDFNVDVNNAVTRYGAFYMLPILEEPHPFAAKSREAAAEELRGGTRNYGEVLSSYRRIE